MAWLHYLILGDYAQTALLAGWHSTVRVLEIILKRRKIVVCILIPGIKKKANAEAEAVYVVLHTYGIQMDDASRSAVWTTVSSQYKRDNYPALP